MIRKNHNENLTKQLDTIFSESGFSKNVHSSHGKCHAGNELILKIIKPEGLRSMSNGRGISFGHDRKMIYLSVMNMKKITEEMNFQDSIACINDISGSNEVRSRSSFEGFSGSFSSKASSRLLFLSISSFFTEDFSSWRPEIALLRSLKIFWPTKEFSNEDKSAVTVLNGEKQNVFIQIKIVEYEKDLFRFSNQCICS